MIFMPNVILILHLTNHKISIKHKNAILEFGQKIRFDFGMSVFTFVVSFKDEYDSDISPHFC